MLLPLPLDAPVTAVETCVQVNVAPAGVLLSGRFVAAPEQMVDVAVTDATGGSLSTNWAFTVAAQPVGVNVMVYVPAVLVNSDTVPVPLLRFSPAGTAA